jgi:hypothetical protein
MLPQGAPLVSMQRDSQACQPVEFAQYSCLQKAIYSVGGIPFPAFANAPEGWELFCLWITALFVHAIGADTPHSTTLKTSTLTKLFLASVKHILQTLYMQFLCFDVELGQAFLNPI